MKTILLLEDDKSLNRGISFTLQKEGYQVYSAFTIQEAEKIFPAACCFYLKYNTIIDAFRQMVDGCFFPNECGISVK